MSHLVELLRTPIGGTPPNRWELQAADRIEALEKALWEIHYTADWTLALAALAPEKDK